MITISTLLEKIKKYFPGGNSSTIDPNYLIEVAVQRFFNSINPASQIRSKRLIGGLGVDKLLDYWITPDDYLKPVSIEDLQGNRVGKFVPPDIYTQNLMDMSNRTENYVTVRSTNFNNSKFVRDGYYTMENLNGKLFTRVSSQQQNNNPNFLLNAMNSLTGLLFKTLPPTSNVASITNYTNLISSPNIKLTLNNAVWGNDFIYAPVTDDTIQSLYYIRDQQRLNDYFVTVGVYIDDASLFQSGTIKLSSLLNGIATDYFISSIDLTNLVNGINYFQVPFSSISQTYNSTLNYAVGLNFVLKDPTVTTNITLSSIRIVGLSLFVQKYLSQNIYVSPSLGMFQPTFNSTSDSINVNKIEEWILIWCGCLEYDMIISSNATSQRRGAFEKSLEQAIDNYYKHTPDVEDYPQYNNNPAINRRKNSIFNTSGNRIF